MKNRILILVAILFSFSANAQKDVTLTIKHLLGASPFAFNQTATNNLSNTLEFTRVDYYISKITLIHDGGMQMAVPNKYLYVRGTNNHVELLGNFNVTNVEGIKFHIGVDSPKNTSDPAQWTGAHPLAPKSPSMHWGWASGFRFAAVEGNGGANLDQLFQFHSLFDANYFEQTVAVAGVNSGNDVIINLDADYIKALKDIDVSAGVINHGDNTNDLTVLKNFRDHVFSAGTGFPLSLGEYTLNKLIKVYPNPSSGNISIKLEDNLQKVEQAQIIDLTGRLVQRVSFDDQKEIDVQIDSKGMYFVQLMTDAKTWATQKVIIQ